MGDVCQPPSGLSRKEAEEMMGKKPDGDSKITISLLANSLKCFPLPNSCRNYESCFPLESQGN